MDSYRGFDLLTTTSSVTVYVYDEGWAEFSNRDEAVAAIDGHLSMVNMASA